MIFAACHLPIEDLPPPIRPQAERYQDDHLFAAPLFPLPFAFIWLDCFVRTLDRDPNPIELDHGRDIDDRLSVDVAHQWLDLIDPFIERSQSPTSFDRPTPPPLELAPALAETTAKEHILI